MARAHGARAQMALAFETVYGTPPASGYRLMPFARTTLGAERPLLNSELLGYGRDPLAPIKDAVTADGEVVVPIDVEAFGFWLKAAFGSPTTTGTTPKTLTFQSGNWTLPSMAIEVAMAAEVQNLFFCYVITREPTRDFERNFAKWATELRSIKSDEELDAFIVARFDRAKADLANRFDDSMGRLALRSLQLYRFQYVLAKFTQQVDLLAYGETEGTRWLGNYVSDGYEVEHIFPQTPNAEAAAEFGPVSDPEEVQRLGNLVLVEKSINTSLGNRPYSEKRPVHQQSKLLLTRALSELPKVGANTRIDRAVASIEPYSTWNEGAVHQRQRSLVTLARAV